jgi:hypothetical protein
MKRVFFFISILFFFSCSVESDETLIQTLIIASEMRQCDGVGVEQCLLVKESENQANWNYFYDPIAGFTHEDGFEYIIRVNREFISENANLSDTSVYEYTLLEILSKEEKTSEGL